MIDLSNTVETRVSNLEKGYEAKIVFVDHNEPTGYKGCYDTSQQFTTGSFENLSGESNTLQAR